MTALVINIDVPDVKAAIAFYTNGLGFRFRRTLFDGTVAELAHAAGRIHLIEKAEGSVAAPGVSILRHYDPHWTPVHIDLAVADLEVAIATAVRAGASVSVPVTVHKFGRLAQMRDPFGHGFCLIEFSRDGYDVVGSQG